MERIGEEQKMTAKEVAAALCVSERVIQKHASEMGLTTKLETWRVRVVPQIAAWKERNK